MKDSGFGSFLAGVVIGGLVGAAIGLLLAPRRGEAMREQVGDFVDERRAALGEAISEGRAAAEMARAEMMVARTMPSSERGEAAPQGGQAPEARRLNARSPTLSELESRS